MADVFGKIGNGLKNTIKEATTQTQKSVDQISYRTDLVTKKNEIKKLYQSLGETHYKAHVAGSAMPEDDALYGKIAFLLRDIEELENKLEQVVSSQKNSFDSYKNGVKATFNDIVADKSEKEEQSEEEPFQKEKYCPKCGTSNHEYAAYCIRCGQKLE